MEVLDEGSQHRGGNIPAVPRFRAIIFDLLTALLDSWTLWGDIAGDDELGARWRRRSLELIYASGEYRAYRDIVVEAASEEFAASCCGAGTSSSRGRWCPPYRAGMEAGQPALFVAGSPGDVPGAEAVGLPVVWHNRVGAAAAGGSSREGWGGVHFVNRVRVSGPRLTFGTV
jgi:hypothetical protein